MEREDLERRVAVAEGFMDAFFEGVQSQSLRLMQHRINELETKVARDGARIGDLQRDSRLLSERCEGLESRLEKAATYAGELNHKIEGLRAALQRESAAS